MALYNKNEDSSTTVRIFTDDLDRIKHHIKVLSGKGKGRYAADDVVRLALNAYEEKIIQDSNKSSEINNIGVNG